MISRGAALQEVDVSHTPLVTFSRLVSSARMPKRADRSGAGYLPSRAMRYCEAVTSSTSFGYWMFPPIDFRLMWDGESIFWSSSEDDDWLPLSGTDSGAIQFPGFSTEFNDMTPDKLHGYAPPFIVALPEAGSVQIWSGFLAKTRVGWSLNVRSPVNLPPIPGVVAWEGIVETDIWLGPLFNNFRITRTNNPVVFRANIPFLQVQPIPQLAYQESVLSDFHCQESGHLTETDWQRLGAVLLPSDNPEARQGDYAVTVRKRRACPVSQSKLIP